MAALLLLIQMPVRPSVLHCQTQTQDLPNQLRFEIASIHLTKPGETSGFIKALPNGGGYTARNIPVKLMISLMYKVPMRQIEGGPEWITSERYDIDTRTDRPYSLDDLHLMYQHLLADRFNLQFHKDIRQGNVYALTVSKTGCRLKVNESDQNFNIPITFGPHGESVGKRVSMSYLCWWLGQQLQEDNRPVIDQTGLTQNYDFTLTFAPELPPDVDKDKLLPELRDRPSIFEAVKDQLGLQLTPQKGPVPYYIVDHVDRPSEN